jgi:hypothetical protein
VVRAVSLASETWTDRLDLGTARNGLAVLVVGDPNESAIVIHHTGSAIGYCKWPGPGR